MSEIVWEEPATDIRRGRVRVYEALLEPLRAEPKRWARIRDFALPGSAYCAITSLRNGRARGIDPSEFEFAARKMPDGSAALYARYIGKGAS